MRTIHKASIILAASLLVTTAGLVAWHQVPTPLQLTVGEPTRQALVDNKFKMSPNSYDISPLIWPENDLLGGVFNVTYLDPQSLHFNHARIVWVNQYAGVVTSIEVPSPERTVTLRNAFLGMDDVVQQLTTAGWLPVKALPSLTEFTAALLAGNEDGQLGSYRKGHVTATLEIASPAGADRKAIATSRDYIYKVKFVNPGLEEAQKDKMYNERVKVNGSVNRVLPFSYWQSR